MRHGQVQHEASQVEGTEKEDHCTCSMSIFSINDEIMIFYVMIDWICRFISCIYRPMLYSIAVKMEY